MISISSKFATVNEQIEAMHEAGIKNTFIIAGYSKLDEAFELLDKYNISCNNFHSEYIGDGFCDNDLWKSGEAGDKMLDVMLKNVLTCKKYGVPIMVIHVPKDRPEIIKTQECVRRYSKLGEFANEHGITIAVENDRYIENVKFIMSLIPNSGFCWDVGHESCLLIEGGHAMPVLGDKLIALHIHDNHCVQKQDEHLVPFDGTIDFEYVAQDIAKSPFNGTIMLETMYNQNYGLKMSCKEFYIKAQAAARKIADRVEQIRKGL